MSTSFPEAHTLIQEWPHLPIFLAVSGGLDSMVLLDWMTTHYKSRIAGVIHVNHQLQDSADTWEIFVREAVKNYDLTCFVHRLNLKNTSEENARAARYEVFSTYLQEPGLLFMGHHLNDQHETLVWKFFRGASLGELTGIPISRPLGQGWIMRPFLNYPRKILESYALERNFSFVTDPTNLESHYTRNFYRNTILTVIEEKFPSLTKQLEKTRLRLQDADCTLDELLTPYCKNKKFPLNQLPLRNSGTIATAISYWLKKHHIPLPTQLQLNSYVSQLLDHAADKHPLLTLNEVTLAYYGGVIYMEDSIYWEMQHPPVITAIDECEFGIAILKRRAAVPTSVTIRRLNKHDKIQTHTHPKGLHGDEVFKFYHIPPWRRAYLPAIFVEDIFLQYGDFCYNPSFSDEEYFDVTWKFSCR